MSAIRSFFRHCPSCGRRFEIRLESKTVVSDTRVRETVPGMEPGETGWHQPYIASVPIVLREGDPIIVDVEVFQYTYKCGHCGHEWSERHEEEHRLT